MDWLITVIKVCFVGLFFVPIAWWIWRGRRLLEALYVVACVLASCAALECFDDWRFWASLAASGCLVSIPLVVDSLKERKKEREKTKAAAERAMLEMVKERARTAVAVDVSVVGPRELTNGEEG